MQEEKYNQPHIIEPKESATAAVIWLHGLGADGYDFADLVPQLDFARRDQTRFIFPHAGMRPVTINGNMPCRAWFDILSLSSIDKEDGAGVELAQQTLLQLIADQEQAGIASERIVLAGFSQGGAVALYTGLRFDKPLAGILALSTYMPLIDTFKGENYPTNKNVPILQVHGEYDDLLPIQLAEHTEERLKKQDYSVEWKTYPIGHQVCIEEIHAVSDWLDRVLK
ncbi:MAG: dienelactone hydrolase family protein [Gammaproteobacteria bacterium]|nr:dienelactone hydrolase family protein [Gammaproteobacteria bacterium]MCH9744326.1 dienelactone hydrolase family protein [Gammaproteobacteria bacterium]